GGKWRDLPAPGDAVAAVAADRAGRDDEAAMAAGVDLPAEPSGGVAQRDVGGHAEVQVPPAGRGRDGERVARVGLPGLGGEVAEDVVASAGAGPPRWWCGAAGGVEVDDQ